MANEWDRPYLDCLSFVHQEIYYYGVSSASLICNCKSDCDIDMQYKNLLGKSGSIDGYRKSTVLSRHNILDDSHNIEQVHEELSPQQQRRCAPKLQ